MEPRPTTRRRAPGSCRTATRSTPRRSRSSPRATTSRPRRDPRIGLAEVERIQAEMREIMRDVGFEGSLQDFFELPPHRPGSTTRTPPRAGRPTSTSPPASSSRDGRGARYFNRLPRAALEVRAVEPFREATATGAFYNQPALDGSRPVTTTSTSPTCRQPDLPHGVAGLPRGRARPPLPDRAGAGARGAAHASSGSPSSPPTSRAGRSTPSGSARTWASSPTPTATSDA
jgi:hypothetical protein